VADVPDCLTLKRHRDMEGRGRQPWARRLLLCAIAAVPVLALADVFGQQPVTSVAASPIARVQVDAADALRGGLLGQQVFRVTAYADIKHATLVLDSGWMDSLQMNTIVPYPLSQADRPGDRLALDFGHLPAGDTLVVRIQFQVDPTTLGSRPQGVELDDGKKPIVGVHRTLTVFP
jgi:hypothetical protein